MKHYNAAQEPFVPTWYEPIGHSFVYVAEESDAYMLSVEMLVHLRWNSNCIDDVPLVCIVSGKANEEYIEILR